MVGQRQPVSSRTPVGRHHPAGAVPAVATRIPSDTTPTPPARSDECDGTRERILRLIVEDGPVSTPDLAARLDLTAAAVRRHLQALLDESAIEERHALGRDTRGRGRPARYFVATERGQGVFAEATRAGGYEEVATEALAFLERTQGSNAIEDFARARLAGFEERFKARASGSPDDDVAVLIELLNEDGYAATVRPVPGAPVLQLCQGHCPVHHVAARFPQLCDAETEAFSRLLGVHVQRLATLAGGEHVCTTSIPLPPPHAGATARRAGLNEGTR